MKRSRSSRHSRKSLNADAAVTPDEHGVIRKRRTGRLLVALVYPNSYAVGMSSLGFQTVYRLLNERDDLVCERAFFSERPGKDVTGSGSQGPRTLESGALIREADIIAFSLSFEADYPRMAAALQNAGLPLLSKDRDDRHPLILAGGVACFLNPEPVAPFLDAIFIGEAEPLIDPFFDRLDVTVFRQENLRTIATEVPGIYVPSAYEVEYAEDGAIREIRPEPGMPDQVERRYLSDVSAVETRSVINAPHTSFGDAWLLEVSRGCPHGCRFCGAGFVYRPPRFRSSEALTRSLRASRDAMGPDGEPVSHIGLMGAAVSDLPCLRQLLDSVPEAEAEIRENRPRFSFSSLRADAIDPELVAAMNHSRLKTATIAPEAGSERLRRVINKKLTEEQILAAARQLTAGGIPNLKLYFMIGLPTETEEDIMAIGDLTEAIRSVFLEESRKIGRMGTVSVSLNPFVPKPFTPFQWSPMAPVDLLRRRIRYLRDRVKKIPNIEFQADDPKSAAVQALFSRGDRRLADLIIRFLENGGNWPQTLKQADPPPDFYVRRERSSDEIFPWDMIDQGVRKEYLWKEYQRALEARESPDCPPDGKCRRCGRCDGTPVNYQNPSERIDL